MAGLARHASTVMGWALGLAVLGVAAHRLFCVHTIVDRLLFG